MNTNNIISLFDKQKGIVCSKEWVEYHERVKENKTRKTKKVISDILVYDGVRLTKLNKLLNCTVCNNDFVVRHGDNKRKRCNKCKHINITRTLTPKLKKELHKKHAPVITQGVVCYNKYI